MSKFFALFCTCSISYKSTTNFEYKTLMVSSIFETILNCHNVYVFQVLSLVLWVEDLVASIPSTWKKKTYEEEDDDDDNGDDDD